MKKSGTGLGESGTYIVVADLTLRMEELLVTLAVIGVTFIHRELSTQNSTLKNAELI